MIDLADILDNRQWLRRERPFPHVVARDVFRAEFYAALSRQIAEVLAAGLSETPSPTRFSRSIPGYDSYGVGFGLDTPEPAAVFLSLAWRNLISGLFDVEKTPYMFAGSHHHAVGSASGFIHNDFNPVWFPRAGDRSIQIPDHAACSYTGGTGTLAESERNQVVRGAVVLFFLLNDGWRPGDGGEIGLFGSAASPVAEPAVACPPINNSLVVFECTPASYHAFLSNVRLPRTSIIMWTHRTMEEALERFGGDRLEQWKR